MRNTNVSKRKKGGTPLRTHSSYMKWMGWSDVKDGLDFRKAYESMSELDQKNYEAGRALANVCKYEWGVIPEWPGDKNIGEFLADATNRDFDTLKQTQQENEYFITGKSNPPRACA